MRSEERKNDNFTIIAADHRIFSDDVLWIYSGKMRTYRCKKQQDSKRFSLVEMIATGIVYVKDNRTDTYQPFISENGKYCKYNKDLGKLTEL